MKASELVRDVFNFTVEKFQLSGPDNMRTPHFGLFRSDNSECVGSAVKSGYMPHTTDDVCAIVESVEHIFGDCKPLVKFRDGHHVYLGPDKAERHVIAGLASAKYPDGIFPRFRLSAGYDGRAFSVSLGYFRDICSNLAMLRQVKGTVSVIRHTNGLRGKMDDLIAQLSTLQQGWVTLGEYCDQLSQRKVACDEFITAVLGNEPEKDGSAKTRWENRVSDIFTRIVKERQVMGLEIPTKANNFEVTLWEAFNGIQGYVQHQKSRRGQVDRLDRIITAESDPLVVKAETLANELLAV
jgi:hypothetical protein